MNLTLNDLIFGLGLMSLIAYMSHLVNDRH